MLLVDNNSSNSIRLNNHTVEEAKRVMEEAKVNNIQVETNSNMVITKIKDVEEEEHIKGTSRSIRISSNSLEIKGYLVVPEEVDNTKELAVYLDQICRARQM